MGMLNIDEHVEEHRLMAIRYPDKTVVQAQSGSPSTLVKLTQAEYNALTPDSNTLYIIVG